MEGNTEEDKKEYIQNKIKSYLKQVKSLKEEKKELKEKINELEKENRRLLKRQEELLEGRGGGNKEENSQTEAINKLEREKKELKGEIEELNEENEILLEKVKTEVKNVTVISSKGDIELSENMVVQGDIRSSRDVKIGRKDVIKGSISAVGDVDIQKEVKIEGEVISEEGIVNIGTKSEVQGAIEGGEVHLEENVLAKEIMGEDKIHIKSGSRTEDITCERDVWLDEDVKVEGSVEYGGILRRAQNAEIKDGVVPIGEDAEEEEYHKKTIDEEEEAVIEEAVLVEGSEEENEEDKDIEKKECPVCKEHNPITAETCENCGAKLDIE